MVPDVIKQKLNASDDDSERNKLPSTVVQCAPCTCRSHAPAGPRERCSIQILGFRLYRVQRSGSAVPLRAVPQSTLPRVDEEDGVEGLREERGELLRVG